MNMFSVATAISLVFVLLRFIDMRVIAKEKRPFKDLVKEGLIVYLSACTGIFLLNQVQGVGSSSSSSKTNVYTGEPSF